MDGSEDIVMNAYVRAKLGMGLPPRRQSPEHTGEKTLTDDLDSISSVGSSFFTRDMNQEDHKYIESILKEAGDDLDILIRKIDKCQDKLKRLRSD